jgi:type II secretory pathway pseudopilin PulG
MRAFTLIETIIYIGLLGMLMTGAVLTAYELTQHADVLSAKNTAGEEGNFVLRKIVWALSGAQTVSVPTEWGSTLSISHYDGTVIDMRVSSGVIQMRENGANYVRITTPNVTVNDLSFHYLPASGNVPAGLAASTTINGLVFSTTRYLRK